MDSPISLFFTDFPDDVQLCVLSFLRPSDLATFATTCKRFVSLYRHDQRLWFSMCDRRWGSKTLINKWGGGNISYKRLYRILDEYENLIGFWRRCGDSSSSSSSSSTPPLVFFEWGNSYISGSRISPARSMGYEVVKTPFLWMSVAPDGQAVSYLDPEGKCGLTESDLMDESGLVENELIQVNVCFIGECHVVLEENLGFSGFHRAASFGNSRGEEYENVYGSSPPDRLMTEIYQYFANRTSPGGNGASRRQRKREKERQGRMKRWEPEHFVKIVNSSPKPGRPLQGLWKVFRFIVVVCFSLIGIYLYSLLFLGN